MIEAEPENRPTAKQALKHPWFTHDKHIIKELLAVNTLICSKSPDYRALSQKGTLMQDPVGTQMFGSFTLGNNFLL
jgi:serine/threonine protein kinase